MEPTGLVTGDKPEQLLNCQCLPGLPGRLPCRQGPSKGWETAQQPHGLWLCPQYPPPPPPLLCAISMATSSPFSLTKVCSLQTDLTVDVWKVGTLMEIHRTEEETASHWLERPRCGSVGKACGLCLFGWDGELPDQHLVTCASDGDV